MGVQLGGDLRFDGIAVAPGRGVRSPLVFPEVEAGGALKTEKLFSEGAARYNHHFPFRLVGAFS